MQIEVAYSPAPGQVDRVTLDLPAGAQLGQALAASGLLERHELEPAAVHAGIWGRPQPPDAPLQEGDRVEIYRPLAVDPKEARRQRSRQGRSSGVLPRKRPAAAEGR